MNDDNTVEIGLKSHEVLEVAGLGVALALEDVQYVEVDRERLTQWMNEDPAHAADELARAAEEIQRAATQLRALEDTTKEIVVNPQGDSYVIVNGIKYSNLSSVTFTYEQVVNWAGMKGEPTITVKIPDPNGYCRVLRPGQIVVFRIGTIFNVQHTGAT